MICDELRRRRFAAAERTRVSGSRALAPPPPSRPLPARAARVQPHPPTPAALQRARRAPRCTSGERIRRRRRRRRRGRRTRPHLDDVLLAGGPASVRTKFRCSACRSWRAWQSSAELLARSLRISSTVRRAASRERAGRCRRSRDDPDEAAAVRRAAAAAAAASGGGGDARGVEIRQLPRLAPKRLPRTQEEPAGGDAEERALRSSASVRHGTRTSRRHSRNYADQ